MTVYFGMGLLVEGFVEVRSLCCEVGFFPNKTYFDTYSIILALIL